MDTRYSRHNRTDGSAGCFLIMSGQKISPFELIAILAMMVGIVAFSIDGMLPGIPVIANELSPEAPNKAQEVLVFFILGLGLGTFFVGPISDSIGRRPVIIVGLFLYITMALMAFFSSSLVVLLVARFFQGLGAAAPRIVTQAIIRDTYSGRKMAQLLSLVMVIFTLAPAVAPLMGDQIIKSFGWRGIFLAFATFGLILLGWFNIRLGETLSKENRRTLGLGQIWPSLVEMYNHPQVRYSIFIQTFCYGTLFSSLILIQPIFDLNFQKGATFPSWFAMIALFGAISSILNAKLVMICGMRSMVLYSLVAQVILSSAILFYFLSMPQTGKTAFALYFIWQTMIFFQAGLTLGNLNALAMEPMGHIAGFTASVTGGISTVSAAALAMGVNVLFDGTPLPLIAYNLAMVLIALGFTLVLIRAGRSLQQEEPM